MWCFLSVTIMVMTLDDPVMHSFTMSLYRAAQVIVFWLQSQFRPLCYLIFYMATILSCLCCVDPLHQTRRFFSSLSSINMTAWVKVNINSTITRSVSAFRLNSSSSLRLDSKKVFLLYFFQILASIKCIYIILYIVKSWIVRWNSRFLQGKKSDFLSLCKHLSNVWSCFSQT